jgi:hypothetical protein
MEELIASIIADLTTELSVTDANFNSDLLSAKVRSATREVKDTRKYPSSYTQAMIDEDMNQFYSSIRDIALYDYNTVGAEFQTSHNENSVSRTWVDRNKLFDRVLPLAR